MAQGRRIEESEGAEAQRIAQNQNGPRESATGNIVQTRHVVGRPIRVLNSSLPPSPPLQTCTAVAMWRTSSVCSLESEKVLGADVQSQAYLQWGVNELLTLEKM